MHKLWDVAIWSRAALIAGLLLMIISIFHVGIDRSMEAMAIVFGAALISLTLQQNR